MSTLNTQNNAFMKDFIDDIVRQVEKTDKHLQTVTKTNLFVCFISFVSLYYPEAKILDTSISIENSILPISIMFMLGTTFSMWGYYLWRFNRQRAILNKYVHIYYKESNINEQDYYEIYKSDSTFELLYKLDTKNQLLGIGLASLPFAINHTALILNFIFFFGTSILGSVIVAIIIFTMLGLCYYFYFRQMYRLYKDSLVKEDEFKIVKYISTIIISITLVLTIIILLYKFPTALKVKESVTKIISPNSYAFVVSAAQAMKVEDPVFRGTLDGRQA